MMEEWVARRIADRIYEEQEYDPYQKAKIEYGLAILLVNLSKASSILLTSIIFFSLKDTLFVCIPYCVLRSSCLGYHAKKSWVCTVQSVLIFAVVPCFIGRIQMTINVLGKSIFCGFLIFVRILILRKCRIYFGLVLV